MIEVVMHGLLLGGVYALVGVGFSLVYGVMNILNVAHGALVVIGGYVGYFLFEATGLDPLAGAIAAGAALFVIGFAIQWFLLNRIMGAGVLMGLIMTFGLELLLVNLMTILFSANFRSVQPTYAGQSLAFFDVVVPVPRLLVFIASLLSVIALIALLGRTRFGIAVRAVSLDPFAAELSGMSLKLVYALTFAVSAALAGIAGSFVLPIIAISPASGLEFTIKSFMVAVVGGLGNPGGAIAGGFVIGLAEMIGASYIGPEFRSISALTLLIVILLVRPQGLFGRRFYAELHI